MKARSIHQRSGIGKHPARPRPSRPALYSMPPTHTPSGLWHESPGSPYALTHLPPSGSLGRGRARRWDRGQASSNPTGRLRISLTPATEEASQQFLKVLRTFPSRLLGRPRPSPAVCYLASDLSLTGTSSEKRLHCPGFPSSPLQVSLTAPCFFPSICDRWSRSSVVWLTNLFLDYRFCSLPHPLGGAWRNASSLAPGHCPKSALWSGQSPCQPHSASLQIAYMWPHARPQAKQLL